METYEKRAGVHLISTSRDLEVSGGEVDLADTGLGEGRGDGAEQSEAQDESRELLTGRSEIRGGGGYYWFS